MANTFQRTVYMLGNVVPLLIVLAIVWLLKIKTWVIPVILLGISGLISAVFFLSFRYYRKRLAKKEISVSGVESQDAWLIGYVLAYLLPLSNLVISDYSLPALVVVILILLLVIIPAVFSLPNFLLFVAGYHFYKVESEETGIQDYLLISKKKKYRSKKQVTSVIRVFEKLLIDTQGD